MTCQICDNTIPWAWTIKPPCRDAMTVCDECFSNAHGEVERISIRIKMRERERVMELKGKALASVRR